MKGPHLFSLCKKISRCRFNVMLLFYSISHLKEEDEEKVQY